MLELGSSGYEVKHLQRKLISLGLLAGFADGVFGAKTEAAVKSYQTVAGLLPDGIVGPKTHANVNRLLLRDTSKTLFTKEKLQLASSRKESFALILPLLNKLAPDYGVDTRLKANHFMAQVGHESGFKIRKENLNYSVRRMQTVFGRNGRRKRLYSHPHLYAHNPKALGDYVYGNRMGNEGEGFRYRGRGIIQLTGKRNYRAFTKDHNKRYPSDIQDFVDRPQRLLMPLYAVESAFSWWSANKVNKLIDEGSSVEAVTLVVNGGLNGLRERQRAMAKLAIA